MNKVNGMCQTSDRLMLPTRLNRKQIHNTSQRLHGHLMVYSVCDLVQEVVWSLPSQSLKQEVDSSLFPFSCF